MFAWCQLGRCAHFGAFGFALLWRVVCLSADSPIHFLPQVLDDDKLISSYNIKAGSFVVALPQKVCRGF